MLQEINPPPSCRGIAPRRKTILGHSFLQQAMGYSGRRWINESIEVAVLFRPGKIIPLKFLWQGKEYAISKINLTYSSWIGRSKIYYFAVSDSANYFKLQFNSEELSWTLLELCAD